MLKGAIFDMDGLLLDTEKLYGYSWTYAAEVFGQEEAPGFHRAVCGSSGQEMWDIVHKYYPEVEDPAEFIKCCVNRVEELSRTELMPKPGMQEILHFFREHGVKIAVASSASLAVIKSNLERLDVLPYFDAVTSGQEVKNGKPYPDIFLLAAERLGLAPEECYVFEDSPNGVRAGAASGSFTVMIPDIVQPTDELRKLSNAIYPSLNAFVEGVIQGEI